MFDENNIFKVMPYLYYILLFDFKNKQMFLNCVIHIIYVYIKLCGGGAMRVNNCPWPRA